MIRAELNPKGNFKPWTASLLAELDELATGSVPGQQIIFEDDTVSVWEIKLQPGERVPFRKLNLNFSWIALTEGLAISRCCDGSVKLFRFEKGNSHFFEFEDQNIAKDLENVGEKPFLLNIMAFKKINDTSKIHAECI